MEVRVFCGRFFAGLNVTKARAHLGKIPKCEIRTCQGRVPVWMVKGITDFVNNTKKERADRKRNTELVQMESMRDTGF